MVSALKKSNEQCENLQAYLGVREDEDVVVLLKCNVRHKRIEQTRATWGKGQFKGKLVGNI